MHLFQAARSECSLEQPQYTQQDKGSFQLLEITNKGLPAETPHCAGDGPSGDAALPGGLAHSGVRSPGRRYTHNSVFV